MREKGNIEKKTGSLDTKEESRVQNMKVAFKM